MLAQETLGITAVMIISIVMGIWNWRSNRVFSWVSFSLAFILSDIFNPNHQERIGTIMTITAVLVVLQIFWDGWKAQKREARERR